MKDIVREGVRVVHQMPVEQSATSPFAMPSQTRNLKESCSQGDAWCKRNMKKELYMIPCWSSGALTGQYVSPELSQSSYLKGEGDVHRLFLDSEVGALIRVTIVPYVYLCNCSIRRMIAGPQILTSF